MGNLWSPPEYSRKSMSYILVPSSMEEGSWRDDIENDDVARNARDYKVHQRTMDRALSSRFSSRGDILQIRLRDIARRPRRPLDGRSSSSPLEKYAFETNLEENGWNSGAFALPLSHSGCSHVNPKPLCYPLSFSRRIDPSMCFIMYPLCPEYTQA